MMIDPSECPLTLRLFGPFEALVNGHPLPRLRSRKGQWLLALLALRAGREVERSWLVAMLWPESSEAAALTSLRTSLKDLRRALGTQSARLRTVSRTLSLDLTGAGVDLLTFDAAIAGGDLVSLEQAVTLHRGPLLEGCSEAWAFEERLVRQQAYLTARERLAAQALSAGDPVAAEHHLRLAAAVDPLRESAQRALMEALGASGNYGAALLVYRELRSLLHRELNTEPDAETRALFQRLQAEAQRRTQGDSLAAEVTHAAAGTRVTPSEGSALVSPRPYPLSVSPCRRGESLEPIGGAVPLGSGFYVVRPIDEQFRQAIARRDSIVLVKGACQMGKTSLLGRGLHQARQAGARVVLTDFQTLSPVHLESAEALLRKLADSIADQLDLETGPDEEWHPRRGPMDNFKRYWRRVVLRTTDGALVWGLDEVDLLFGRDFASEVLGLFRSWHNERVLNPDVPWRRLTLAISYATEAHLFIRDVNQSPFNVGTRLTLDDFTLEQIADLNERYGSPLHDETELRRFTSLVGGHPYLVRLGLHDMVLHGLDVAAIEAQADRDEGVFGSHLRRLVALLNREAELREVVQRVLQGQPCPTLESFYRLRSAGIILGETMQEVRPRCQLYARYLERHLV